MPERSNQNLIRASNPKCTFSACESGSDNFNFSSPNSDREMAIRCTDWNRLEKRLARLSDYPKDYSALYGIFFGLFGSACLSIIPLAITRDLPPWVLPLYIVFTAACLFSGIFVLVFDKKVRKMHRTIVADLLEDVREIGSRVSTQVPSPTDLRK